jgi:FixJ family two-component response regulator
MQLENQSKPLNRESLATLTAPTGRNESKTPQTICGYVYLVDDDAIQRQFIHRLCVSSGFKAISFSTPHDFLAEVGNLEPGCLLLDMMMPGMDGLALFQHVTEQRFPLTCVLMTSFADTTSCRAAFRAGMYDFVDKDRPPMEILETIKLAIEHQRNFSNRDQTMSSDYKWKELTERESDVAELLMDGRTLKQIAAELDISVQTASKHRSRVFDKVNVSSEVELLKATLARSKAA